MFLAAIRPPNNAETALMEMKHKLYSETGIISAWALKPIIPLAFFTGDLPSVEKKQLPCIPSGGIGVEEPVMIGNQFCLSSAGCRAFCGNVAVLFSPKPDSGNGFSGVHLFDTTEPDRELAERMIQRSINLVGELSASVLNWKSCSLEIYEINSGLLSGPGWWKSVILETVLELNFPAAQPH